MYNTPCARSNQCFKSHWSNYVAGWADFILVDLFKYFPTLPWLQPRVSRGKRCRKKKQGCGAAGQRHALQSVRTTKMENQRTAPDSFVFGHERLFEVHWLGLNSPNTSSHPLSTNTGYLFTSLHPPRTDKTRGRRGKWQEESPGVLLQGWQELRFPVTAAPLPHSTPTDSFIWHPSLTLTGTPYTFGCLRGRCLSAGAPVCEARHSQEQRGRQWITCLGSVCAWTFPTAVAALRRL